MIQMQSSLTVADNSGARELQCIKVLGGSHRRYAGIGDVIKVSVKEALPRSRVKKGDVYNALYCSYKKRSASQGWFSIAILIAIAAVLLNNKLEPIGTRVFGPIARELRCEKFMKIISLAPEVL